MPKTRGKTPKKSLSAKVVPKTITTSATIFSRAQVGIFLFTYISYIIVYMNRKALTNTKTVLQKEQVFSEKELGGLDTAFLTTYALAQFASGGMEAALGSKRSMVLCFLGTSVCTYLFGTSTDSNIRWAAWALNGLFQAMFYPFVMSILTEWFPPSVRGRVLGLWGTCPQIAGFTCNVFASYVLSKNSMLVWQDAFMRPAYLGISMAVACLTLLPTPSSAPAEPSQTKKAKEDRLSFFQVLGMQNVSNLGGAYLFIKLVRYTFIAWLPSYLVEIVGYSDTEALLYFTVFDIAGAFGSVGSGFIADILFEGKSVKAVLPMCFMCSYATFIYPHVALYGKMQNMVMMGFIGIMIAGPDCVLGSAACAEVCEQAGQPKAIATASGIVNGLGSVGAIASGLLPVYIKNQYGWTGVFYTQGILSLLGLLCILPMGLSGMQHLKKEENKAKKQK